MRLTFRLELACEVACHATVYAHFSLPKTPIHHVKMLLNPSSLSLKKTVVVERRRGKTARQVTPSESGLA